jgi:hypothetical protein
MTIGQAETVSLTGQRFQAGAVIRYEGPTPASDPAQGSGASLEWKGTKRLDFAPGSYQVSVANPDGQRTAPIEMTVLPNKILTPGTTFERHALGPGRYDFYQVRFTAPANESIQMSLNKRGANVHMIGAYDAARGGSVGTTASWPKCDPPTEQDYLRDSADFHAAPTGSHPFYTSNGLLILNLINNAQEGWGYGLVAGNFCVTLLVWNEGAVPADYGISVSPPQ